MNIKQILKDHINSLYSKLSPSFISVYYNDKPVVTKTILSEKKKRIEETLGLIIYKGHQINEIIPGFGEEYIYTEGEGIQIYIHFVTPEISIVTLAENKVKFSLLKLEHEIVSRELRNYADQIKVLAEDGEKFVENAVTPVENTETEKSEQKIIKDEESSDKIEEHTDEIEELEKVLSEGSGEKTEYEKEIEMLKDQEILEEETPTLEELLVEDMIEETTEERIEETTPSLEEILIEDKEENVQENVNYLDVSVLDKIYKNLAKEMGPVARIIFNKKIKDLKIDRERLLTAQIKELIDELSKDILVEKRRERFIKNCNNLI